MPEAPPRARWARVVVVVAVLVANAPYLLGVFDPNPLLAVTGLQQHQLMPGWWRGSTSLDPNAGFTAQANGHRAALDWLHLRWPWWNRWESTGVPLAGALASGATFVPFVLLTAIPNGQVILFTVLEVIAGLATFELLRRLDISPWISCVGGVLFALDGTAAWFRFGATNPVAFLPVVLLGVECSRRAVIGGRRGGWVLIAIGTAFSVLASFPETAAIDGALVLIWLVARAASTGGWRPAGKVLGRSALGGVIGTLLAAPAIVAQTTFSDDALLFGHEGSGFGHLSLPSAGTITAVAPYALGPLHGLHASTAALEGLWGGVGGYLTAAVLVAAVAGLVGRRLRSLRIVIGVLAAVLVARNFGLEAAVTLVRQIPGAAHLAVFRYDNPVIELAATVLACLALDDGRRQPRRLAPVAGVAALVAIGLGVGAWQLAGPLEHRITSSSASLWWTVSLAWALGSAVIVAAAIMFRRHRVVRVVAGSLLALEAVAMFAVPEASAPPHVRIDTTAIRYLRAHVGTGRFFSFGPFQPNYGAYYGIPSLDVNDNPLPRSVVHYELTRLAPDAVPVLFNGQVGTPSPLDELPAHLDGYRHAGVDELVLPHGMPLPALPAGTTTLTYHDQVMDIYAVSGAEPYFTATAGCTPTWTSTTSVTTTCTEPGTLLRRETMLPGWTATEGGRSVPIRSASGGFQQVGLPVGRTTVRFAFAPPHVGWALIASVAGLVILIGVPLAGRFRGRHACATDG